MTESPKRAPATPISKKDAKAVGRSSLRLRPPDVANPSMPANEAPAPNLGAGSNDELGRHRADVWRYLNWLRVPEFAVDELTQEVFLIAHTRRGEFRGESSFKTWLWGIAFHLVLNWRRRQRTRHRWEDSSSAVRECVGGDGFPSRSNLMDQLVTRNLWECAARVLDEQPEAARRLWWMVAVEEMGMARAGEVVGLSEHCAQQLFTRTHLRMKQELTRK